MAYPRAFDHERALDLWRAGWLGKDIAAELGTKTRSVTAVIRRARERNDQRAKRRYLTFLDHPEQQA